MRIATWNVNSLTGERIDRVLGWLDIAEPDVLCLQETKLADEAFPALEFHARGYDTVHHGEGRWNGVAIASRCGIADVVTNFGQPLQRATTPEVGTILRERSRRIRAKANLSKQCPTAREIGVLTGRVGNERFHNV